MLKAVLFDLDQTLLDWSAAEPWEPFQRQRLTTMYDYITREVHALDGQGPDALYDAFSVAIAQAWRHAIDTLEAPDITEVVVEMLRLVGVPDARIDRTRVMHAYNWRPLTGERLYPDVMDVLLQLRDHRITLGVITNASAPMRYRDLELDMLGVLHLFSPCRLAAADAGVIKPHPRIFEQALGILGIRPEEAVFVGDNREADVKGAQGVGMRAVWLARDENEDDEQDAIIPDGTIGSLHELPLLLDAWYPGWRNGDGP